MLLVETLPGEKPRDVEVFLEGLIRQVYGRRPGWLEYDLRDTYQFRDQQFIQMFCPAGSVHAHLALRASTGEGIARDILELGLKNNQPHAWLLHRGQRLEYDPNEVRRIDVG